MLDVIGQGKKRKPETGHHGIEREKARVRSDGHIVAHDEARLNPQVGDLGHNKSSSAGTSTRLSEDFAYGDRPRHEQENAYGDGGDLGQFEQNAGDDEEFEPAEVSEDEFDEAEFDGGECREGDLTEADLDSNGKHLTFPGEEDDLPGSKRLFHALNRLQQYVPQPVEIQKPRARFVHRKKTYVDDSVLENPWWCTSGEGRDWLQTNWSVFRMNDKGQQLINYCHKLVDDEKGRLMQQEESRRYR